MAGTAPHIPGCRDLSLIGEGVARSLFSATSDRVGRPVTVTVFPPLGEGRTRDGFDRAAATAQRLGAHPSVITIHEWGHAADGRPWIVTEPQPAESLDTLLVMDGPVEVERALQVGALLAGALETAHRAGIVHGDLSPARLVFGAHGEPLLADTGLAEFAVFPGLGALNNPVRYYAPPEVLERTEVGPTTDVFSLAATVYALLAGRAPQQKPAEITDSNASLLLRILQMPVPRIERPDLPPGLEDVLRSAMSPSPDRRPQTAIEVAWLLQDVQRRAGYGVTEPVVLDLDDLAGDQRTRSRSTLAPAVGAPPPPPEPPPLDPLPEGPPEVEPSAPTIFPFDEGGGAPRGAAGLFGDTTGTPAPLWPSPSGDDQRSGTLWPSSWPTDGPAEVPAWALAPPSGPPDDDARLALGGDGGSLDDLDGLGALEGLDGPGDLSPTDGGFDGQPTFGAIARPPELDELPAWYTDPLPNAGGPTANGRSDSPFDPTGEGAVWSGSGTGHPFDPAGGGAPWPGNGAADANGNGRSGHVAPQGDPVFAPWPIRDERLPGAGDELRSLFGEVVGDPSDPGDTSPQGGQGDPGGTDGLADAPRHASGGARPGPASPLDHDADPLGPPRDRPPIDLSQLDTPLGPSPYLPPAARPNEGAPRTAHDPGGRDQPEARGADTKPPARLPRRHEVEAWQPAPGGLDQGAGTRPATAERALGPERSAPRQVAPAAERDRAPGPAAATGPPALPLIVLIAVVAVLILGVAWLVLTGDDAATPASDRGDRPPAGAEAAAPADVKIALLPEGMHVTWAGAADTTYVVTMLSPDAPPKALPPVTGASLLVPNVELGSGGDRCFTVAAAQGADGGAGPASAPVCTPGAAPDGMQGA